MKHQDLPHRNNRLQEPHTYLCGLCSESNQGKPLFLFSLYYHRRNRFLFLPQAAKLKTKTVAKRTAKAFLRFFFIIYYLSCEHKCLLIFGMLPRGCRSFKQINKPHKQQADYRNKNYNGKHFIKRICFFLPSSYKRRGPQNRRAIRKLPRPQRHMKPKP